MDTCKTVKHMLFTVCLLKYLLKRVFSYTIQCNTVYVYPCLILYWFIFACILGPSTSKDHLAGKVTQTQRKQPSETTVKAYSPSGGAWMTNSSSKLYCIYEKTKRSSEQVKKRRDLVCCMFHVFFAATNMLPCCSVWVFESLWWIPDLDTLKVLWLNMSSLQSHLCGQ